MSIWQYSDHWESKEISSSEEWPPEVLRKEGGNGWVVPQCIYCGNTLFPLGEHHHIHYTCSKPYIHVCTNCGWWLVSYPTVHNRGSEGEIHLNRTWGQLRQLDLSDISAPIDEVQSYLFAKYGDRFNIHPRKYEELVASIFKNLGYQIRLTSYSKDDGIDVFVLDGQSNDTVGVQVKRYRNKIEADQIRAFAGALVLEGLTKGVFVTTGGFRSGAISSADSYKRRGLAITLWNADQFYDRMKLVKRPRYDRYDDSTAPYFEFITDPQKIPRCWTRGY